MAGLVSPRCPACGSVCRPDPDEQFWLCMHEACVEHVIRPTRPVERDLLAELRAQRHQGGYDAGWTRGYVDARAGRPRALLLVGTDAGEAYADGYGTGFMHGALDRRRDEDAVVFRALLVEVAFGEFYVQATDPSRQDAADELAERIARALADRPENT